MSRASLGSLFESPDVVQPDAHTISVAFASGVKVMKPDMHVIVIAGDGDLAVVLGLRLGRCRRLAVAR